MPIVDIDPQTGKPWIEWSIPLLRKFKRAHRRAKGDLFEFEGHELPTNYASYLIAHLEDKFGLNRKKGN